MTVESTVPFGGLVTRLSESPRTSSLGTLSLLEGIPHSMGIRENRLGFPLAYVCSNAGVFSKGVPFSSMGTRVNPFPKDAAAALHPDLLVFQRATKARPKDARAFAALGHQRQASGAHEDFGQARGAFGLRVRRAHLVETHAGLPVRS